MSMIFANAQDAFNEAIAANHLSIDPNAENYAGRYMYMGTWQEDGKEKVLQFKHSETRKYFNYTPNFINP